MQSDFRKHAYLDHVLRKFSCVVSPKKLAFLADNPWNAFLSLFFFFSFPFRTAEFAPEPGFAQSSDERRWLPLLSCCDTGGGKHLGFDSYTGMSVFSATTWSVAFDTPATSLTSSELQEHMTDCILTSHILFGETFL